MKMKGCIRMRIHIVILMSVCTLLNCCNVCQCLKCSRISVVNGTVTGTKGHVVGEEEESREKEEEEEEVGRGVINLPQESM